MRPWLGIILVLALAAGPQAGRADPFQDATWAYEAGDFKKAMALWRPLAEQGDSQAQMILGIMHDDGYGVDRDVVGAHMWHNLAGANGNEKARRLRDTLARNMSLV